MRNLKITAGALVGALLVAGVAGCSTSTPGPQESTPPPVSSPAPTAGTPDEPAAEPVAEPEETPVLQHGDILDVSDRDSAPEGLLLFPLGGRDYMLLDPAEPLPDVVLEEIREDLDVGLGGDVAAAIASAEATTGKRILLVDSIYGTLGPPEDPRTIWSVYSSDRQELFVDVGSSENGLAMANEYVASQPNPENWVIITIK